MKSKIRWRIALPYIILITVILLVLGLFLPTIIRRSYRRNWEEHLLTAAALIADQANAWLPPEPDPTQLETLAKQSAARLEAEVIFFDPKGALLAASSAPGDSPAEYLSTPELQQALTLGHSIQVYQNPVHGKTLNVAVPVHDDAGTAQAVLLIQVSFAHMSADLKPFYWALAITALSSITLVLILSLVLTNSTLKPLSQLTQAAKQMGTGQFEDIDIPQAVGEIAELSQALRQTALQLSAQIEALTTERSKLAAVLTQMTDGVLIADSDGRVQLLNSSAERLFRIKEASALGRSVVEVMRHHQLVDLWSETKEGEPKTITLEIGAEHTFLQVIGIPLSPDLPGRSMLLFQDITQLHRLEIVRRDFVSNVSHELRTPLASLKALTETLLEGALEDPPAARRFIVHMDTEVDNLTLLVHELLELSRIESGKITFEFQRIQPRELLEPACERMSLQADRVGLALVLECPPELPLVFADRNRISQVVINLLHNAIKFTAPGGKITVSAKQESENMVFLVQDTGVGIAQKDLPRIFERFYKADRARSGGGTGLGLSIARHMVEAHGGHLWVESQEGVGSTFFFSIPIA